MAQDSTAAERALLGRDLVTRPWCLTSVLVLDGHLDLAELRARIAARLAYVPRLRQRLAGAQWLDDQSFELERHVRELTVPGAGSPREVQVVVGDLAASRLSHDHPVWEVTLLRGVAGHRSVVVVRLHPAWVDGDDHVHLLQELVEDFPSPDVDEPTPWTPTPDPEPFDSAMATLFQGLSDPGRLVRRASATVASVVDEVRARPTGPERRRLYVAWADVPSTLFEAVTGPDERELDVLLSAVADALAARAAAAQDVPRDVVALVPLTVEADDRPSALGVLLSPAVLALPVTCPDVDGRVEVVASLTQTFVDGGGVVPGGTLSDLSGLASATLHAMSCATVASASAHEMFLSDVGGPREPRFVGEHRLLRCYDLCPPTDEQRLSVLLTRYAGTVCLTVTGYESVDDFPGRLTAALRSLAGEG